MTTTRPAVVHCVSSLRSPCFAVKLLSEYVIQELGLKFHIWTPDLCVIVKFGFVVGYPEVWIPSPLTGWVMYPCGVLLCRRLALTDNFDNRP